MQILRDRQHNPDIHHLLFLFECYHPRFCKFALLSLFHMPSPPCCPWPVLSPHACWQLADWWEVWDSARRLILTSSHVFFYQSESVNKIVGCLWVSLVSAKVLSLYHPHIDMGNFVLADVVQTTLTINLLLTVSTFSRSFVVPAPGTQI